MPANVESMFYVRQAPWHGLGVRVEEAPSSQEALRLSHTNSISTSPNRMQQLQTAPVPSTLERSAPQAAPTQNTAIISRYRRLFHRDSRSREKRKTEK